ncbi:phosphoglycolate phosphatase [Paracoccus bogoriensis]|nr:phosphoglycolate phosphatase [Paracoccus bogoriensis]MBW7056700.1 phosphoglycolate phosphatase [Paracoccus bogoriensis]
MPCPVIFDLDGTLIDSAADIHACVNAVLRENGVSPLSLPRVRSFIGGGVEILWSRIIAARGIEPARRSDLVAAFMARYHHATILTRLYPGVVEALAELSAAGHPLGICTNKPLGPTRAVLDHFGLTPLFRAVIGGDSLTRKKPDPAPLRAAFAALGARTGVFVGDSEFDADTAAAMGVPFLLFTQGYRHSAVDDLVSHAHFSDFAALPGLVAQFKAETGNHRPALPPVS